ncbi:hypothetical protein [Clostridium tetani]|uniref:hypothetical protein n=1 Tax=Clostridium tetani TaxID=1513 RepID=UPI00100B5711|nr:hypothetical protein [Clostridium tetani]RXM57222.1 hypothetical protein DP133_11690 [Clostridium tetani]
MTEEITLDTLTRESVSVKKQKYIVQDNKKYTIGNAWRRVYINSVQGRQQVEKEIIEPYKSVIMLMWGDKPTIIEEVTQ